MTDDIPHRQFKTYDGQLWDVWEVHPERAYNPFLHEPWLCFENAKGERWRYSPIPHGWDEQPDSLLRVILAASAQVQRREA